MKYAIRSLKYLILFCVLYVAMTWLSSISQYDGLVDVETLLRAQLGSERGLWLVVCMPLFTGTKCGVNDTLTSSNPCNSC